MLGHMFDRPYERYDMGYTRSIRRHPVADHSLSCTGETNPAAKAEFGDTPHGFEPKNQ
jgi:hypothetical protein